jgi:hypothetical protein
MLEKLKKLTGGGCTSFDLGPRIVTQDSGRLLLQCFQWERVSGFIWLAFAVLWLWLVGSSRLTCNRPSFSTANCQITRFFGPGLFPFKTTDLGDLTAVLVVSETRSPDEEEDYQVYDVQLIGTKTTTRLGLHDERNDRRPNQIYESIQRFLANPAQSNIVVDTPINNWSGTILPPAVSSIIACDLLRRKAFRFEFDRLAGTLQIFGANGRVKRELSLGEVESIAIEQWTSDESVGYRVVLVMKTGDRYPLTQTYSSGLKSKQAAAEAVRAFLKLPPVEMD